MNYPFWDVGIGYGLLMPIIAVIHVFFSHFAIGSALYLVVADYPQEFWIAKYAIARIMQKKEAPVRKVPDRSLQLW